MALTNTQYDTIIREYNKKQLQNRPCRKGTAGAFTDQWRNRFFKHEMCPPPSGRGGCFDR